MDQLFKPKPGIVTNFGDLDEFNPAAKIQRTPSRNIPKADLSLAQDLRLISFDPSITNTGWVVCDYTHDNGLVLVDFGVIKTVKAGVSWDDTLTRAQEIYEEVGHLLHDTKLQLVLHEMPPVGSGHTMHNAYAPIVSSTAVRCAATQAHLPVGMVAANRVKKYLTGDSYADKKAVQKALIAIYADLPKMNEHAYDALGIAHVYVSGPT